MGLTVDKKQLFGKIGYEPHAGQWLYHNSKARFKVPCCGRRYGKSTMGARDAEPLLFEENKRLWIVGPTYDLGEKEFRVIWTDLIINQKMGQDKRIKKAYNKRGGTMYIEFPWQTRIEVRTAEHPENLVGESLDHAIMSEAAKHSKATWERYIRPSLSDRRGTASFPTTPEGFNWFYDIWMLGQDPESPLWESWRFPSWSNSAIFPGGRTDPEILDVENTTTPEWFMQEYAAEFGSFVGKIYSEFDVPVHVRKIPYNPVWKNYIAFDWGFVQPLAAIEFMVDPWDNIYIWREHYKSYTLLLDHIAQLKAREQPSGYHLDLAFGDAADPEAAATVSTNLVQCMALPESKTNWREGVDLVKSFLKLYQVGEADEYGTPLEAPKLYVDYSCQNVIREFSNYRSVDATKNTSPNESGARGAAQKQDDHALDALRYALVHLYKLGANTHLSDTVGVMSSVSTTYESSSLSIAPTASGFFNQDMRF